MIISPVPGGSDLVLDPAKLAAYQQGDPQAHLDAALATARSYCGWHIAPTRVETVSIDTPNGWMVAVPSLYLLDVVEVDPDGIPYPIAPGQPTSFTRSGLVYRSWSAYSYGQPGSAWLTITHGYPELPPDVLSAVVRMAGRTQASPTGGVIEQAGPFAIRPAYTSTLAGVGEAEAFILDRYRLPGIA